MATTNHQRFYVNRSYLNSTLNDRQIDQNINNKNALSLDYCNQDTGANTYITPMKMQQNFANYQVKSLERKNPRKTNFLKHSLNLATTVYSANSSRLQQNQNSKDKKSRIDIENFQKSVLNDGAKNYQIRDSFNNIVINYAPQIKPSPNYNNNLRYQEQSFSRTIEKQDEDSKQGRCLSMMNFYNSLNNSCEHNQHPSTITLNDLSFNKNSQQNVDKRSDGQCDISAKSQNSVFNILNNHKQKQQQVKLQTQLSLEDDQQQQKKIFRRKYILDSSLDNDQILQQLNSININDIGSKNSDRQNKNKDKSSESSTSQDNYQAKPQNQQANIYQNVINSSRVNMHLRKKILQQQQQPQQQHSSYSNNGSFGNNVNNTISDPIDCGKLINKHNNSSNKLINNAVLLGKIKKCFNNFKLAISAASVIKNNNSCNNKGLQINSSITIQPDLQLKQKQLGDENSVIINDKTQQLVNPAKNKRQIQLT